MGDSFVLRIGVPSQKLQKALKAGAEELVWALKKQMVDKLPDIKDALNYGLFLHGKDGKQGKFMEERKTLSSYGVDASSQIEFLVKHKIGGEHDLKKQKKLYEDYQKGNLDRIKEKVTAKTDFNFWFDPQGNETPLSIAVMNNDAPMINFLIQNGAFWDFRLGDAQNWKTPLHLAALHNKAMALKIMLDFGAWVNCPDANMLTPIFHAATAGSSECVLRLLIAKADTEVFDDVGKGPIHQAALNNFDCIVALLIDFGCNLHATNVAGNTPLHVSAARNLKESVKWLLMRGADPSIKNKSGKTALDLAVQANSVEAVELLNNFHAETVVIPPPKITEQLDPDTTVTHVLSCLADSIGGEYKPQPSVHVTKTHTKTSTMTRSHSRTQSSMFDELPDHKRGDSNASGRSQTSRMSGYNSLRATQRPKGVSMLQQSSQLSLNQESHSPKDETKKVLPEHLSDSQSSIASSHSGMPIGSNATLNERNNRASLLDGRPSLRTFPPEQSASHASSLNQQLFSPPPVEEKRISNPPVVSSQLENEIRPEETAKPIVERFKAPQLLSSLRQFVAEHPLTQQQDHEVLLKRLSELEQSINDEFKNYNQLEEQKQQLTLEIERLQQK